MILLLRSNYPIVKLSTIWILSNIIGLYFTSLQLRISKNKIFHNFDRVEVNVNRFMEKKFATCAN